MHVVLDYRPALRQGTGVGTYVHNLIAALCDAYPADVFSAFSSSWKDRIDVSRAPAGATLIDRRIPVQMLDWSWHRLRWPAIESLAGKVDIAHSPSPMLLPARRARTVVTVNDCYFMRHPEDVFGPVRRDYVPLARHAARAADAVVAISESTAAEAQECLGIPRDKICVAPLGVEPLFFDAAATAAQPLLQRQGVDRPFLLFVGRREKRKDLATLLTSFDAILAAGHDVQLVLAGADAPGWKQTWTAATDRSRRATKLLPYTPPETLAGLYAAATLVVLSSRWEGFGLTGLEAMAAGTPVIASEVGALPEVLGDAALFAAAGDAEAMAMQCRKVLDDTQLTQQLVEAGREHARGFPWSATAHRIHGLYERLVG